MSLKIEINNTNTHKENLKIGKKNIDNKLVEIGGERAIDIADIPNKIQVALDKNWTRTATVNKTFRILKEEGKPETNPPNKGTKSYDFRFTYKQFNLAFIPKSIKATVTMRFFEANYASGEEILHTFTIDIPRNKRYIVYKDPYTAYRGQAGVLDVKMDTNGITFTLTHAFNSEGGGWVYGFSKYSELTIKDITASSR